MDFCETWQNSKNLVKLNRYFYFHEFSSNFSDETMDSKLSDLVAKIGGGKFDFSNTVTITPIPKNHQRDPQIDFPKSNNLNSGVEIRMVQNPTKPNG